jgi:hypothetical protein
MDVMGLCLRAALSEQGDIYQPYSFAGAWTDLDRRVVAAVLDVHCPAQVDSMFNNWTLWASPGHFSARRATWDLGGICADSAVSLAVQLQAYYEVA